MSKVVMIDDNQMEHLIMQKMCDRYELLPDLTHCDDGREILEFLKKNQAKPEELPDIIFLDLNMPQFSGWQFLDQFKKLYPFIKKTINIYIFSSSVDKADKLRSKLYPFVKDFYQKPIKRENLELLFCSYTNINRIAG